jgi:hypothetical protein
VISERPLETSGLTVVFIASPHPDRSRHTSTDLRHEIYRKMAQVLKEFPGRRPGELEAAGRRPALDAPRRSHGHDRIPAGPGPGQMSRTRRRRSRLSKGRPLGAAIGNRGDAKLPRQLRVEW